MTVSTFLKNALDAASPIGFIPMDYPFLDKLCREAHIGYEDKVTVTHEKRKQMKTLKAPDGTERSAVEEIDVPIEESHRRWYITYDPEPYPKKRRTESGRVIVDTNKQVWGTLHYTRFCAILEYVVFRADRAMRDNGITGELRRNNILDVAIGQETSVLLPDGSRLELGKKVADLKRTAPREVFMELSKMGLSKYDYLGFPAGAALPKLD